MRDFAALYAELDRSTSTKAKVAAMAAYFRVHAPADCAQLLWVLSGAKLKRTAGVGLLRTTLAEATGLPLWLIEDTHAQVGDLAETIALLVRASAHETSTRIEAPLPAPADLGEALRLLQQFAKLDETAKAAALLGWWRVLPSAEVYVLMKLITGALRVGVSAPLVQRAAAEALGLTPELVATRLSGGFLPTDAAWEALARVDDDSEARSPAQPYPFFLASPLEQSPETLGEVGDFQLEWKWDGIRAQLLLREGEVHLYSRGEEMLDGRFPEVEAAARIQGLDGLVLDGELIAWAPGAEQPLPFLALQSRINLKKPGKAALAKAPVRFLAYDLLEADGVELRERPLAERRALLETRLAQVAPPIVLPPLLTARDWSEAAMLRAEARERGVEGLMLKRRDSVYRQGRKRGDWWKWKVAPLTLDAVLVYAQAGHGRRANLYTDLSFAVWDGDRLAMVAKAYSGLSDAELTELDRWIRAHTTERFGPVRAVQPLLVFELAFEAVQASSRHKAGVAVRFPRILRWRRDKTAAEADRLETLKALAGLAIKSGAADP